MRNVRVGSVLLTLGLVVGVVGAVGLFTGFEPSRLPAALLNIAAYKLTFLAAAGLMAAGAIVIRVTRRSEHSRTMPHRQEIERQLMSGGADVSPAGKEREAAVHDVMKNKG